MTTKLSERLRELETRLEFIGMNVDGPSMSMLAEAIAQAEAQEKLAFFEARVKPSSDDPDAQAGELSDEEFSKINQAYDEGREWNDFERSMFSAALRYARDHGYLRPSQAIGEPVAWMSESGKEFVEQWVMESWKTDKGPTAEYFIPRYPIPLYRSPISTEARDKAIEAGSNLRNEVEGRARIEAFMSTQMDLSQNERDNHEIRSKRMTRRIEAWDQALSALRGITY